MWYYMHDGAQQGPISEEELVAMAEDGRLQPTDMVWKSGMAEWQQANEVPSLPFSVPEPEPNPAESEGTSWSGTHQPGASASTYGQPGVGGVAGGEDIPNYLVWSILATIFCCQISGIVAIVFSSQANTAKAIGNFTEARNAAKQAKTWLTVSVVFALLIWGASLFLFVLFPMMAAMASA